MFKHEPVSLGYDDLSTVTGKGGRFYEAPTGTKYPSVTTVLSILSEDHIREWRARVGEEEANKISHRASTRGTEVHDIFENYVDNDPNYMEDRMPHILETFKQMKPVLDERLSVVHAQEAALYSDHLGLAGRVDLVGVWDGKLSIIDYKTSAKTKRKEWCENYFVQEAAYAIMWEERTGIPITQLVTVIAGDEGNQIFIEHRDNWTKKLLDTIAEYRRRKFFGQ